MLLYSAEAQDLTTVPLNLMETQGVAMPQEIVAVESSGGLTWPVSYYCA